MAKLNLKTRYAMTRWTGLDWVHHSTLTMTETRKMLIGLRVYPHAADAMRSLDSGEVVMVKGYRFALVTG